VDIVVFDGWGRNANQIKQIKSAHLFENSLSLILQADDAILRQRQDHREKHQFGGPRTDHGKFEKGLAEFKANWPQVLLHLQQTQTNIRYIDADRDLMQQVVPEVLLHANAFVNERLFHPSAPKEKRPFLSGMAQYQHMSA